MKKAAKSIPRRRTRRAGAELTREGLATFGQRLRERRIELGLTQEELAKRVKGYPAANSIARYERGLHLPQIAALRALAITLNCSADYLLCGR